LPRERVQYQTAGKIFDRGFPKDNPRTVLYNSSGERFANPQAFVGGGGAFPGASHSDA
jgi:hypothetical protein